MLRSASASLALSITLLGCGSGTPPPPQKPTVPLPASPAATVVQPELVALELPHLLPHDTEAVFIANSPRGLYEALRFAALRKEHASVFENVAAEMAVVFGEDLLSLNNLERLGLAVDQPAGFAWLDSEAEAGCIFGSLTDPDAFKSWVYRAAGKHDIKLAARTVDDTLVLTVPDEDEVALLLRENHFVAVAIDRDRHADSVIRRLARMRPAESLAGSAAFETISAAPIGGEHLRGFVSIRAVREHMELDLYGRPPPVLSDIQAVGFGLSLSGPSPSLEAVLLLEDGAAFPPLLEAGNHPPAIFSAGLEEPALVFGGYVKTDQVGAFFEELMKFDRDPARSKRDLEEELGLGLHAEIAPALTGEMGFAMTLEDAEESWMRDRFTVTGGLAGAAGKQLVSAMQRALGSSGRPTVSEINGNVVITDSPAALDALRRANQPTLPEGMTPRGFFDPGSIAWLRVDASLMMHALFGFGGAHFASSAAMPQSAATPAEKAVLAKIEELNQQEDAQWQKMEEMRTDGQKAMARLFGTSLVTMAAEGPHLRLRAHQALRVADFSAAISESIAIYLETEERVDKQREEVDAISAQLQEQYAKLEEIRAKQTGTP